MQAILRIALAAVTAVAATQAQAQVTLYERDGFQGRSFSTEREVRNLERFGFNDRASSVVIVGSRGERWEVCEERAFRGRCVVLRPGEYASLAALGLNDRVTSVRHLDHRDRVRDDRGGPPPPVGAPIAQVDLYENEGFQGRSVAARSAVDDFRRVGFNDRASAAVVTGGPWEVCDDVRFGGRCVVLRPGQYPSLSAMGLNDRVSSARRVAVGVRVDERRYAPLPVVSRDYRRRDSERLFEADVTSVRAVVEDGGRQCWIEPEQVVQEQATANVPGALLGAVIGGILGHQVGGGTGRDVATGIGVVAGAAIGANTGRGDAAQQVVVTQNVQHCARAPGAARPAYWDVTYGFRGQTYKVQMNRPPGRTVTVNEQGEPRG